MTMADIFVWMIGHFSVFSQKATALAWSQRIYQTVSAEGHPTVTNQSSSKPGSKTHENSHNQEDRVIKYQVASWRGAWDAEDVRRNRGTRIKPVGLQR